MFSGVPEISYTNNSSPDATPEPKSVLPVISSPTTGIGPVEFATLIPSKFSAVAASTAVTSPVVVLSSSQLLPVPVATYTPGFAPVL